MKSAKKILSIRIIITLSLLILGSMLYWWHRIEIKNVQFAKSNNSEFYLIDPARSLYKDENLVTNIEPLRQFLKSLPEREKDKADISIYFEVLTTGANVSVNPDMALWPASLAKLPIAMVVMNKIEQGNLSLDQKIIYTKNDQSVEELSNEFHQVGASYSVKELLEKLLLDSSNSAYHMLKRQTTPEEQKTIVQEVGLEQLFTEEGKVSAKEYSRLFRSLYVASYLNPDNSQFLLGLMKNSTYQKDLKAGLPPDVSFAHKWGENALYKVYSDSGIVYANNRPYLIGVLIQTKFGDTGESKDYADSIMREISERAYKYVSNK
jgi:beta-lactamase class A